MADAPLSPGQLIDSEHVALQLQQFLDEWYYRIMHSSLAKSWDNTAALSTLLDVFLMLGISIDDKDALLKLGEESLVNHLSDLIPPAIAAQFELIALQLQNVVHAASRIRKAAEASSEAVQDLFEEADITPVFQEILKNSVVHSAKEVTKLQNMHSSWRKSTEARVDRLGRSADEAEHVMQQLVAIEAQLDLFGADQKHKTKNFLMGMAEGQDKTLAKSAFSAWHGRCLKVKAEKTIRDKFEKQIIDAENQLLQYKAEQVKNVRGVLMRASMEEDGALKHGVFTLWSEEVSRNRVDAESKKRLGEVQGKLAALAEAQRENAKHVMARMAAGSETAMATLCFQSWITFVEDYKKDKEMNDAIKMKEQEFQAHMAATKEETKAVLNRLIGSSETGLMSLMISQWNQYLSEEKKAREMKNALLEVDSKFKSLNMRQTANARGVQTRINEQINLMVCMRVFGNWLRETKANRISNFFNHKYANKKRQLQGVQQLFKSFAMQLEQSLGGDDDKSARTITGRSHTGRSHRGRFSSNVQGKHQQKGLSKGDGTVSLPSIHHRPGVA